MRQSRDNRRKAVRYSDMQNKAFTHSDKYCFIEIAATSTDT